MSYESTIIDLTAMLNACSSIKTDRGLDVIAAWDHLRLRDPKAMWSIKLITDDGPDRAGYLVNGVIKASGRSMSFHADGSTLQEAALAGIAVGVVLFDGFGADEWIKRDPRAWARIDPEL